MSAPEKLDEDPSAKCEAQPGPMKPDYFRVGDVVRLKSGGPKMTVSNAVRPEVTVYWFDGGEIRDAVLFGEMLSSASEYDA